MNASYRFLLLAFLWPAGASAQDGKAAALREIFQTAWQQASAQRPDQADTAALRAYLIYPYLQAERLRWSLSRVAAGARDEKLDSHIRVFLTTHAETPVTRELQRDWLRYLGERAAWAEFQRQAPPELSDPALQCYRLAARLAANQTHGLREAVLALWLAPRAAPAACDAPFTWLDTAERLSDAEIEQRARVATEARRPLPAAVAALPPERKALMLFWQRVLAQPASTLKRYLNGENLLAAEQLPSPPPGEIGEALVLAFERLARQDSTQASALFEPLLKAGLDETRRGQAQRAYALGLAYDHDAEALRQFDLPAEALDTLAHEWRVRAALLHGDWPRALQWLSAMPEAQRQEPRWQYWRARALDQLGEKQTARVLFEEISGEREYYGFLAAERLGRRPDLRPVALPEDKTALQALSSLGPMQRARELFQCDLPALAAVEFREAQRDWPAAQRTQAAQLAASWGWHEQAVLLLSELKAWDDLWLRFPTPFEPEIKTAAATTGLDPGWLYTVLRTESLYNPRAVSRADALGLMQLRLSTAREVAQRAKLARPAREDLFEPKLNLALGARYLSEMHQRFNGRFIFTLAAYNAGPNRVPGWQPESEVPGDVWVENVPYNETRAYIQRALSNLVMTGWRRSGAPTAILPLLTPVTPHPSPQPSPLDGERGQLNPLAPR